MKNASLLLAIVLSLSSFAGVRTPFPGSLEVDGKKLELNGTGTRKATWLKVHVYDAALYLEKKSGDAAAIVASPEKKQVDLKFLRSVSGSDIAEAWQSSFKKTCETDCEALQAPLSTLKKVMSNLKKGDVQTYRFDGKGLTYLLNGKEPVRIDSEPFARVLLSMWIGKNPPNEDLRDGLLGK